MTEPPRVQKPQRQRNALTVVPLLSANRRTGRGVRHQAVEFFQERPSNLWARFNPASISRVRASGLIPHIFSASSFPKASLRDR